MQFTFDAKSNIKTKSTDKFLDHLKALLTTCASSHQLEVLVYPCFLEFKIKYQVENMIR